MAKSKDQQIADKDIVGLKYFDQLGELLQLLHDVGRISSIGTTLFLTLFREKL